jgi:UDP-N-acetyl-2-amino-2-deoxyglucuronate dehydrogenase
MAIGIMGIGIGVVGCGRISKTHFDAITRVPGLRLAGCCDIVEGRARSAAKTHSIPYWNTRIESLLEHPDVDLVSICTPSGLHPSQGILAAQKGKDVLTEKPMGLSTDDADGLIKVCRDNGVRLFVVLQNRFNPAIQLVKRAIDAGRFGKLHMIVANVFWTRPQEYYDLAPWRGTWAMDGGAFCNQASHYVDLVQWFGGPVASVTAQTATLARRIEAEDTGSAILRFRSGCIGTLNVTMLTYPENLEGSITIIGETGTVRVGGIAVNQILDWRFDCIHEDDLLVESASNKPDSVYGFGHAAFYQSVRDSILGNRPPVIDGLEGRASLEIIQGIYQSNKLQKSVQLG